MTRPTTTNSIARPPGKNDLSEALMGDEAFQNLSHQAMLGLPSTKGLLSRFRLLNLREKLEVTIWNQRFWPVLPLFVKAEMNAPLTVVEEITTWIVLISWLQAVVLGNAVSLIVGGVALFLSLTILHFWYGKSLGGMILLSVTERQRTGLNPAQSSFVSYPLALVSP